MKKKSAQIVCVFVFHRIEYFKYVPFSMYPFTNQQNKTRRFERMAIYIYEMYHQYYVYLVHGTGVSHLLYLQAMAAVWKSQFIYAWGSDM